MDNIRYEPSPSTVGDLHRFVILDEDGKVAVRFDYCEARNDGGVFWLTGGYQPWRVMQALAALIKDCEYSTWESDPDEFLRTRYPQREAA